jgi:hypothetical protein
MTRHLPAMLAAALLTGGTSSLAGQSQLFDGPGTALELRIASDFKGLMAERDSLQLASFPGRITYTDGDGRTVPVDAQLKLRGHWRRQKNNCDFAPIKVDFTKEATAGTIFENQGDLKLVVHCRKGGHGQQWVLREYLVYRLYNILTPLSLRTRLIRAWYVDTTGRSDSLSGHAFFLENARRAADRNGARILEAQGAKWDDLDPEQGALLSAFEYFIGGSDWSLPMLHNIMLFKQTETGVVWPVAYDFDWTGIVDAAYAFPDARLPIKSVRQRIYRGVCRTPEEWAPLIARFQGAKPALYAVYDSIGDLDPKYVLQTRKYLDQFFEVIGSPDLMKREMIDTCRKH